MSRFPSFRRPIAPLVMLLFGLIVSGCGGGQSGGLPAAQQPGTIAQGGTTPTVSPSPSASPASSVTMSITPSDTAAAATIGRFVYHVDPVAGARKAAAALRAQAVNYPADLTNFGGAVISHASSYNIYVNCASTCWGSPQSFMDHLNNSTFIHTVDQYVGSTANARYGFGTNLAVSVPTYTNYLSQGDIVAIVHAAAQRFGNGYTHIYHVFIPAGVDTCFDGTLQCYSPDNTTNMVFCAYHASGTFTDSVGHVVYTVLPYQNVPGCQAIGGPNSTLTDSTDSTYSHEYFETLTDPDPATGWYNTTFNQEMADLCQPYEDVDTLDGARYLIQEEYSNKLHACTND